MWLTCYNAPDLAFVRARGIPSMRKKSVPQTEATWLLLCLLKVLTSLKRVSLLEGQGRRRSQPWFTPLDVFANYVPMWIHAHVWFLILTLQFTTSCPFLSFSVGSYDQDFEFSILEFMFSLKMRITCPLRH